jgi:uncharacterized protein involved in outer membrane biogenesis
LNGRRLILVTLALLLGAVLVLIVGLAWWLPRIDLSALRPQISEAVEQATGRRFALGTRIELGFEKGLVVRLHDLALANADWGSRTDMLTVEEARGRLALWPMLSGQLVIEGLSLQGVDLLLERDDAGQLNWVFVTAAPRADGPLSLPQIRALTISGGRITWRPGDGSRLVLDGLDLDARDDMSTLNVDADAALGGESLRFTGRLDSPQRWSAGEPITLSGQLSGPGELAFEGRLGTGVEALLRLDIDIGALDPGALGRTIGISLPALPPVDLSGRLSRQDRTWRIEGLDLSTGTSEVAGELTLVEDVPRPRLEGRLHAKRLDLDELLDTLAPGPEPTPAETPDEPRHRIVLPDVEADLDLTVDHLVAGGRSVEELALTAELADRQLRLSALTAHLDGAPLSGQASLSTTTPTPRWQLTLAARGLPVGWLLGPGNAAWVTAPADIDLDWTARGNSPAQILGALDGSFRLVIGAGRARLGAMDRLVGGLSTLTGQLLEKGSDDARLNCAIADLAFDDGVAQTRVLLIDSAASTVRGDGRIDLGRQSVDLTFTPRPKSPTLTVAVPVHVRGALSAPSFEPDQTSTLKRLLGVASIFVYPPAALAGLGDLGERGDACASLLQADKPTPETPGAVEQVTNDVGDAFEALGRGLRGLFDD